MRPIGLSSTSNDFFLTWIKTETSYLRFRQWDQIPLAPQNYTVSIYQSGTNRYPQLNWSLNNEPDVRNKTSNAYKIERRTKTIGGQWSVWSDIANLSGSVSSFIDYSIANAGGGDREAEYRLTAIDIGGHSSTSQSLIIEYGMGYLEKKGSGSLVNRFELSQNYPNPFNPSTRIAYSIKEEGLVTLKVYDVLGNEVATLVNENKPEGNYEVDFNASELPSGMYIYSIQSKEFNSSKKMLLMK